LGQRGQGRSNKQAGERSQRESLNLGPLKRKRIGGGRNRKRVEKVHLFFLKSSKAK